jgi:hypothetical protein
VFWIETVASYQLRTGLGPNQAGTEIVISRGTNLNNGVVAAELAGIDEITVNSGAGTDTFIVSGDFTGTDLDLNTITIEGSPATTPSTCPAVRRPTACSSSRTAATTSSSAL